MKKKIKYIIFLFLIIIIVLISFFVRKNYERKEYEESIVNKINDIKSHYSDIVKTNKACTIYIFTNDKYEEAGMIGKDVILSLKDIEINKDTKYFVITSFEEEYYVLYDDVDIYNDNNLVEDRYKKYIPFNENIVTDNITEFYDDNNNLIYKFNKSFNLPIIIKDDDGYFVEYNNRLFKIKKDNVKDVVENNNTDLEIAKNIRVIAYHAFYDPSDESEKWCRTAICHPVNQIEEESKYLKENDYFTLTTKELNMFIDGKINLPKKSIMITIDDGLLAERGLDILVKYELNATLFLITKTYKPELFTDSKYIEYHSHGNDLHNVGACPGGQGGGIKCLDKEKLVNDLKTSSEILHGSTVFCYPFYEYNNYSIEVLKEAGYTMAFAGCIGSCKVNNKTNKYIIPRYTITSDVTLDKFISIIK